MPGADALVPNSVLRVMSDVQGALCHLVLQYLDWLALQLLPDTAEAEWLDRHGAIWLTNADGSSGRKMAQLANGIVSIVGEFGGIIIPVGTRLTLSGAGTATGTIEYETTQQVRTSSGQLPTPVPVRALDAGAAGNLTRGTQLALTSPIAGVTSVTAEMVTGGTDEETDDELRYRVLDRIRNPPQGGAAHDYQTWALAVPGVTRAWVTPLEMGIGTTTVRIMMDTLRADNDGFPVESDLEAVRAYLDTVRPVAVKDFFVAAPIKQQVNVQTWQLTPNTPAIRAGIEASIRDMLYRKAAPGQTIFAVWKAQAIMDSPGVISFELADWRDDVMQSPGHMAVLGNLILG